jgi:hypothetical protein
MEVQLKYIKYIINNKEMKRLLIVFISLVAYQLQAQESFSEFISFFPKYSSWESLPEDIRDITISNKTLDADKVNIYIYGDISNPKTWKSPLRMARDSTYFKGDEGRYDNKYVIHRAGEDDTIIYYKIYPLARVHINDSICIVFLLYDGPGAEYNYFDTNLYYEAYTFNIVKEQVLSSITLFKDAEMFFSYIRKDRYIYIYEDYEYIVDNESEDYYSEQTIFRRTYHLRDDGYLQLTYNEDLMYGRRIAAFTVIDPDGYTNVREEPTTQSKILYKIEEEMGGFLEITDNPNWYKVIYSKEGGGRSPDRNNFIKGWIHKSRVCFDANRYGWKKGDPQVCK